MRAWAAPQLGLAADTPLGRVEKTAVDRLAELTATHRDLVHSWEQLTPVPTLAQIERRLKAMDPETAALARSALPELAGAPRHPAPAERPERTLAPPALSR